MGQDNDIVTSSWLADGADDASAAPRDTHVTPYTRGSCAGFRYRRQAPRGGLRVRRGRGEAADVRRPDTGRTGRHGRPACGRAAAGAGPRLGRVLRPADRGRTRRVRAAA